MKAPQNNRMQVTGSARCEGGSAPPPQLIRVFDGHLGRETYGHARCTQKHPFGGGGASQGGIP
jgi:hypothetical protein